MLMEGRDVLMEQVRLLTARLEHLQRELGSETQTIPVQLVDPSRPISALKPPDTGRIPLQGPDGERLSVQVRGKIRMPRQGVTAGNRPTWVTG